MRSHVLIIFVVIFFQQVKAQDSGSFHLINLKNDERNPVLTPDGKVIYFTVTKHSKNIGGINDEGDIWFSSWDGLIWSAPVHAGNLLNDQSFNAVAGFSTDGEQMYLVSHYGSDGKTATTQGISVSRKTSTGWSKPQNISIPYFQNKSDHHGGHITPDGTVYVFAAETFGTHGVEDIYVSIKQADGKWSEPKNLGATINTQFQEFSPSLSSDTKTLYFSSNGRKGAGSFDVFMSDRLDDTWRNWSEPKNITIINTDARELYYRSYAQFDFSIYTSTKNSDGYGELRLLEGVKALGDSLTNPVVTVTQPEVEKVTPEVIGPVGIRLTGRILNASKNTVIPAKLVFHNGNSTQEVLANASGYETLIQPDTEYRIRIESPGYVGEWKEITQVSQEFKSLELDFKLQPIEVGTTVTLQNVLFIQSKAELLPQSYAQLDEVVEFLKANPHIEIELSGHTDNRGSFRQLLTLSQQRVNRVKHYLVSKGIEAKRITGKGYGGSKPIAGNDTEESRALNRRVEFVIKKL